jgi:hypothetical protein
MASGRAIHIGCYEAWQHESRSGSRVKTGRTGGDQAVVPVCMQPTPRHMFSRLTPGAFRLPRTVTTEMDPKWAQGHPAPSLRRCSVHSSVRSGTPKLPDDYMLSARRSVYRAGAGGLQRFLGGKLRRESVNRAQTLSQQICTPLYRLKREATGPKPRSSRGIEKPAGSLNPSERAIVRILKQSQLSLAREATQYHDAENDALAVEQTGLRSRVRDVAPPFGPFNTLRHRLELQHGLPACTFGPKV